MLYSLGLCCIKLFIFWLIIGMLKSVSFGYLDFFASSCRWKGVDIAYTRPIWSVSFNTPLWQMLCDKLGIRLLSVIFNLNTYRISFRAEKPEKLTLRKVFMSCRKHCISGSPVTAFRRIFNSSSLSSFKLFSSLQKSCRKIITLS